MNNGATQPLRVLAVGAHADDVEFMCAGTLIRLAERGHRVAIATLNNGSCGSASLPPDEIVAIRTEEARAAAALIGADYYAGSFPDLELVFDNRTRRNVVEIFRHAQPDIVLTHYPQDYMADHDMTSMLVRDASFTAALGNYPTGSKDPAPKLAHIPYLYYWSPMEGVDWFGDPVPMDIVVDVSEVIDRKIEMLCCHASQRDWLREQHGMDEYVDFLKRQSADAGAARGYAYGEAFRQHRGHAYRRDDILSALLEQPVH